MYWLNIADRQYAFVQRQLNKPTSCPGDFNDKHIVYVSNYLDPSSPYFQMNRDELLHAYLPHLKRLNSNFSLDWIEQFWHFKEAAAQPLFPLNYSSKIPGYRTPVRNLYLGNTTQIYPEDRGTNYSVRLGQTIARLIDADSRGGGWSSN